MILKVPSQRLVYKKKCREMKLMEAVELKSS